MTTALEGDEGSSRSGRSLPRERPGTHRTGGLVGTKAGLDGGIYHTTGIRTPEHPARSESLYRVSYPTQVYYCHLLKGKGKGKGHPCTGTEVKVKVKCTLVQALR